jgi:hypothetical protein
MKTALNSTMRMKAFGSLALTNCGRNAKKKIVSFGFRMLTRMADTITLVAERGAVSFSTVRAPFSFSVLHATRRR